LNKKKVYGFGLLFFEGNKEREEKELVELLKRNVSNEKARVLENGMGTGRFISVVHRHFPHFSCFGTDVVPDFVNQKLDGIRLSLQSAEKFSFENNFFDALLCIDVLHHVPNREKALKEMNRITKNGGLVIFRDIRPKHSLDKLFYRLVDLSCFAYNSNMPRYFKEKEWEQKLEQNGFRILEIKKFDSQLDWIVCKKNQ
jgi:ubiquinone/menaquinone biosynthesis C-methylase UbiE